MPVIHIGPSQEPTIAPALFLEKNADAIHVYLSDSNVISVDQPVGQLFKSPEVMSQYGSEPKTEGISGITSLESLFW